MVWRKREPARDLRGRSCYRRSRRIPSEIRGGNGLRVGHFRGCLRGLSKVFEHRQLRPDFAHAVTVIELEGGSVLRIDGEAEAGVAVADGEGHALLEHQFAEISAAGFGEQSEI